MWNGNSLEMHKVSKKAKFGFNLRGNTSRMRTATAFISSVILCHSLATFSQSVVPELEIV